MRRKLTPQERKQAIIVLLSCFLLLAVVFIWTFYDAKKMGASLIAHEGFTTGIPTSSIYISGRSGSYWNLKYSTSIKGKIQTGTYSISNDIGVCPDSLLGYKFPVIYDTTDAEENYMVIFPEDFKNLNLPFPDSLKWVLKFNKR